jgi:hypothetical protein
MPCVEFEPTIPASERAKILCTLYRAATVAGNISYTWFYSFIRCRHEPQVNIYYISYCPHIAVLHSIKRENYQKFDKF